VHGGADLHLHTSIFGTSHQGRAMPRVGSNHRRLTIRIPPPTAHQRLEITPRMPPARALRARRESRFNLSEAGLKPVS